MISRDDKPRRHRRRETVRIEILTGQQPVSAPPPPATAPVPKPLCKIYPIQLEENIGGGRGVFASVSVLEPVLRVERSGPCHRQDNPGAKAVYRIVLNLKMQVAINRAAGECVQVLKYSFSVSSKRC